MRGEVKGLRYNDRLVVQKRLVVVGIVIDSGGRASDIQKELKERDLHSFFGFWLYVVVQLLVDIARDFFYLVITNDRSNEHTHLSNWRSGGAYRGQRAGFCNGDLDQREFCR